MLSGLLWRGFENPRRAAFLCIRASVRHCRARLPRSGSLSETFPHRRTCLSQEGTNRPKSRFYRRFPSLPLFRGRRDRIRPHLISINCYSIDFLSVLHEVGRKQPLMPQTSVKAAKAADINIVYLLYNFIISFITFKHKYISAFFDKKNYLSVCYVFFCGYRLRLTHKNRLSIAFYTDSEIFKLN